MPSGIKKIYLIRHGETEYNRLGIVQGSGIDAHLNATGQQQASAFFEYYKNETFDKIYTSALVRTHQSVKHFLAKNINWEQDSALNEISWGDREGKIPDNEDNMFFGDITKKWSGGQLHLKFTNGESPVDVAKRQAVFLEKMLLQKNENTILVAMHGRAMKILLATIICNDLSKMDLFEHTNLCLYLLEYNYNSNTFEIIKNNNTEHLKPVKFAQ
jgi:2,3-bisphosphoglycerate-dependent phosphoglycerate mutase